MFFEWVFSTDRKTGFFEITGQINEHIKKAGIREGQCIVYCPHATAGIVSTENADGGLILSDLERVFEKIAPENGDYHHSDGNAHAHIKACLAGNSKSVLVRDGKLLLGTWEGIFLAEFDGPRGRRIVLSVTKT